MLHLARTKAAFLAFVPARPNALKQINLADKAFGLHLPGRTMTMTYDANGNMKAKTIDLTNKTDPSSGLTYSSIEYNSDKAYRVLLTLLT